MNHRIAKSARWLGAALLAAATLVVAAPDADTPRSPDPGVSAEAQAVLDRMSAFLSHQQAFEITATSSRDEVLALGYKLQDNESTTLLVQRPDKLRVDVDGDLRRRSYIYDGKALTVLAADTNAYAQVPAPESIDRLLNGLLNRGVDMPLIDVLLQAFKGTLAEGARAGLLVGESRIDGVACDHLAFRQATIDWQLWVEKGDRPVPRKLVITTRHEVGDPQFQVSMAWNLKPAIDAKRFAFAAPEGARRIEFNDPTSGGATAGMQ